MCKPWAIPGAFDFKMDKALEIAAVYCPWAIPALLICVVIIEFSKLPWHPLTSFARWFGNRANASTDERLDKLSSRLDEMDGRIDRIEKDRCDDTVKQTRRYILDFENSCRNGRKHTKEEFDHVIDEICNYNTYCSNHHINNGVITNAEKYLTDIYQERLKKNDFLA